MGGTASNLKSFGPHAAKTTEALKSVASAAATSAKRKVQKEGRQFMAPERAQKELERQQIFPKRAPLNVGRAKISEESQTVRKAELEKHQEQDPNYLSLLKDIFVTSKDSPDDKVTRSDMHSDQRSPDLEKKLPKNVHRARPDVTVVGDIPRGRAQLRFVIEALYNHKMNPEEWGPAEIADRLKLRHSDTKDLLSHFELLDESNILTTRLPYDTK